MTPVTFTLTLDDMIAGNRLAIRRYVRKGAAKFAFATFIISLAVCLIAFGMKVRPFSEALILFGKIFAIYAGLGVLFAVVILFSMPKQRARKNFAQMPSLSRDQTVSWDDATIAFTSGYGNANIPLAELHRWAADDGIVIIYPADHLFYMLPARVFEGEGHRLGLISALERSSVLRI